MAFNEEDMGRGFMGSTDWKVGDEYPILIWEGEA